MDNLKVIIKENEMGKSLFAKYNLSKDEIIAAFDGQVYESEKASDLPKDVINNALQFEEHKWADSKGIARYINHSCSPNCGIKNKIEIVPMRDIKKGEELTIDYDMSENSDWVMECKCGSKNCRKVIKGYRFLPKSLRNKYRGYISEYLIKNE